MRTRVACIATFISAALLLLFSTGRRAETVLGVGHIPTEKSVVAVAPTITTQDETIAADKHLLALGETVTFHIEPKQSFSSAYPYVYDFGDGSQKETHKNQDFVRHRYKTKGTFKVSVEIQSPPGIAPNEAGDPEPITIEVRQVQVSADPSKVEVGIPVTVTATSVSKDPNLRYRFTFRDKEPEPQWQESNTAVHAYSTPGPYQASVEVGFAERRSIASVDSNDSPVINVAAPPPGALVFRVEPHKVTTGEQVTLSAEFPSKDRHIQYHFVFGDGTASQWQDGATVTHIYQVERTYHPYVEVGVLLVQTPSKIATSPQQPVNVIAVQSVVASPTQTSNSPRTPTRTDWKQYLIPILIGFVALLVLVIFTAGVVGTYKGVKWAFAPRPTFVPHLDQGRAEMAQGSAMPVIEFELHLDPNVGDGFYEIIKSGPSLMGAERSQA